MKSLEKNECLIACYFYFSTTMSRLLLVTRIVTGIALALNVFVYFYPEILNSQGVCNWADFGDGGNKLEPKYPLLNTLPENVTQRLLLAFPLLVEKSSIESDDIHMLTFGDPQINGNWPSTKYIKRLDNLGNDYYLGHIYNTMKNRLHPSHVAVMGDQFSSQWILDSEFYNRTNRFVDRLFTRPLEYKKLVKEVHAKHEDYDWQEWLSKEVAMNPKHRFDLRLYSDVYDWYHMNVSQPNYENPLFINLTGNHDIGYSGDATWQHMARFHYLFGQNNFVLNYNKGTPKEWRLVVVDSLTLDGPALQEEFLNYTWSFLDHLKTEENPNFHGATVLLTHIPMYKAEGLCADGPDTRFYVDNEKEPYKNGCLRSQNHLTYETSQKLLDIVFPNKDQNGVILTGHDHVGCDSWLNKVDEEWVASKERDVREHTPVREIVVRSMMGDFEGQTGVFTGHYDQKWQFEFSYCSFAVQHWWWVSKVLLLVAVLLHTLLILRAYI